MSSCCICENEVAEEDPIFKCSSCKIKVHKYCYGIETESADWICSPCSEKKNGYVKCQLCLQKGGALKKTTCGRWVHVICALFTHGVKFSNESAMEPVEISNISKSGRNKMCSFCYSAQGYASSCAFSKCKNRLHISCAQKTSCLEEKLNTNDNSIHFKAYCKNHGNASSGLSTAGVKGVVNKKRQHQFKKQAAVLDCSWLMVEIDSQSTPKTSEKFNKRPSSFDSIFSVSTTENVQNIPPKKSKMMKSQENHSQIMDKCDASFKEIGVNTENDMIQRVSCAIFFRNLFHLIELHL